MTLRRNALVFMCVASVCAISHAESLLQVGDNVVVTQIDGQSISHGLLSDPIKQFKLAAGQHSIVAKYERMYELSSDEHDVVRSMEIRVDAQLEDAKLYNLVMANQPEDYDAAVKYAEKPTLTLSQGGHSIASKTAIVGSSGIFSGIGKSLGGVFTGTGYSEPAPVAINTQSKSVVSPSTQSQVSPSRLDQFMKLWLEATPTERQKIKNWVADK